MLRKSLLATLLIMGCTQKPTEVAVVPQMPPPAPAAAIASMKVCFLLYNMKTDRLEKVIGEEVCRERFPACSTFKVPLAVMAFDFGVLKDEEVVLKWDGKKGNRPELNQDHNAKTWMRDSVVWFSQRLTPRLGKRRLEKYLKDFEYGNKDLSAGITQAWLVSPSAKTSALKISGYEQLDFMKKLWRDQLAASKRSQRLTREITFLETSPNGFRLSGKTGSNVYEKDRKLGWFISHLQKGDAEYLTVMNFSDLQPKADGEAGGPRAKKMTKDFLEARGLW